MTELVFSVFVVEIKNAWKTSVANEDLIQNLYDAVALPLNLTGRNGEPISVDKSTASRIKVQSVLRHQWDAYSSLSNCALVPSVIPPR